MKGRQPCHAIAAGGSPQTVVGYRWDLPDGTIRQYVTYQEAEAANQRAGGTGSITIVMQ
ncbi:DUF7196 family protein [Streptomyces decoyicus]|uniref:DUF7196 family protein n=1 Tax=Streptomyces decoyicus TaxID=249567 RepID=UPI000A607BCA|nr:hypothetical protein [Streptomyces decoyicus]QZY21043.1 hypothetical protein K7C20_36785 [Streptomyces decoyicus]